MTKLPLFAILITLLTGCTFAKYEGSEGQTLTVIDLHPTGNTVALDAALEGKGTLTLNREQGSTDSLVESVGDAINPGLLP